MMQINGAMHSTLSAKVPRNPSLECVKGSIIIDH
jgi:hypothetical protein